LPSPHLYRVVARPPPSIASSPVPPWLSLPAPPSMSSLPALRTAVVASSPCILSLPEASAMQVAPGAAEESVVARPPLRRSLPCGRVDQALALLPLERFATLARTSRISSGSPRTARRPPAPPSIGLLPSFPSRRSLPEWLISVVGARRLPPGGLRPAAVTLAALGDGASRTRSRSSPATIPPAAPHRSPPGARPRLLGCRKADSGRRGPLVEPRLLAVARSAQISGVRLGRVGRPRGSRQHATLSRGTAGRRRSPALQLRHVDRASWSLERPREVRRVGEAPVELRQSEPVANHLQDRDRGCRSGVRRRAARLAVG